MLRTIIGLCLAVLFAPSFAGAAPRKPAVAVAELSRDGWPQLTTSLHDDSDPTKVAWRACTPTCGAVISRKRFHEPGPTAVGTVFELTATRGGSSKTSRTPPWQGQATSLTPPAISGDTSIGGTVTATAGTWSGGWPTDTDDLSIRACPTGELTRAASFSCVTATTTREDGGAPLSMTVTAAYAGWYFSAVDGRDDAAFFTDLPPGLLPPPGLRGGLPAARPERLIAVSPLVGPVPTPTAEQEPTVKLFVRAKRRGDRYIVGTLRCPITCGAYVTTRQRGKVLGVGVMAGLPTTLSAPAPKVRRNQKLQVGVEFPGFRTTASARLEVGR